MGKIIVISNQKGGCGKSMTAANLGIGLARQGQRVLIVDADSQHSLTISLGIKEPDKLPITLASVMANIVNETAFDPTEGIIRHSEGVDLLPANIALAGMELSLDLRVVFKKQGLPGLPKRGLRTRCCLLSAEMLRGKEYKGLQEMPGLSHL